MLSDMSKPDLPKRLAARVRAAQAKLGDARRGLFWGQHSFMQSQARLAEYARDPEAFARKHYPGHGIDSYPVTTTISRERDREAHHIKRRPERIVELKDAERHLEAIEREVLAEVQAMRPSGGRVPWPAPLPTFDDFCESEMQRFREEEAQAAIDQAADDAEFDRWQAEEAAEIQRQSDADDAAMLEEMASWSPDQLELYRVQGGAIVKALRDGKITMQDIIDRIREDDD